MGSPDWAVVRNLIECAADSEPAAYSPRCPPGGGLDAGNGSAPKAATHGLPAVCDIQLASIESGVVSVRWVCQTDLRQGDVAAAKRLTER